MTFYQWRDRVGYVRREILVRQVLHWDMSGVEEFDKEQLENVPMHILRRIRGW